MGELGPGLSTRLFGSPTRVMELAETGPASEPVRACTRDRAYHDDETQALMWHVRCSMRTSAVKISEAGTTPGVWT